MIAEQILIGLGFNEKEDFLESKNAPWLLVKSLISADFNLTERNIVECVQNSSQYSMTKADIVGKKLIYVYSWSAESLREVTNNFADLDASVTIVFILGVFDPTGVSKWSIDLSKFKGKAYAFVLGPDLAFPVDIPISRANWISFETAETNFVLVKNSYLLNINCSVLARPVNKFFAWFLGAVKVWNHTNIMNDARLLNMLVKIAKETQ